MGDSHWTPSPLLIWVAERHALVAQTAYTTLGKGGAYLLLLGGHLRLCPPVNDVDLARASAQGGACGVHRSAAAADHGDHAAEACLWIEVELLEEGRRRRDAAQFLPRNIQP